MNMVFNIPQSYLFMPLSKRSTINERILFNIKAQYLGNIGQNNHQSQSTQYVLHEGPVELLSPHS